MWYRQFFVVVACLAASVIPATAQTLVGPGLFGFYDPATGAFRPVMPPSVAPAAGVQPLATVSRGGNFVFKITIKIVSPVSAIPAATKPYCSAGVSHSGTAYLSESVSKTSNRVGDTATCVMSIPFLWPNANNANGVSASIYVSGGSRSLSHSLEQIPLPPNAATTTFEVTVRL
jgi:hypothetical protein